MAVDGISSTGQRLPDVFRHRPTRIALACVIALVAILGLTWWYSARDAARDWKATGTVRVTDGADPAIRDVLRDVHVSPQTRVGLLNVTWGADRSVEGDGSPRYELLVRAPKGWTLLVARGSGVWIGFDAPAKTAVEKQLSDVSGIAGDQRVPVAPATKTGTITAVYVPTDSADAQDLKPWRAWLLLARHERGIRLDEVRLTQS